MSQTASSPQERIQQAYSSEAFQELGQHLISLLSSHLQDLHQRKHRVLNWNAPEINFPLAKEKLLQATGDANLLDKFDELLADALHRGHNLPHPQYIGHQVPASIPLTGLFDAIGSVMNHVMAIYEMGPWITSIENALIQSWGEILGLSAGKFSGLVTHGGSLANLTALLTARNVTLENSWSQGLSKRTSPPVLVAHADSHYCVTRSAGILGIGTDQVISVPLDEHRRMDPNRLAEILSRLRQSGTPIIAVAAAACATPIGAFDPLQDISDVCQRHNVWMHVDAAHGGAVSMSETHRHLIDGIHLADSFICDAHKTLFVPALCAFVFYKEHAHAYAAFQQDAPYLFDPSAPDMAFIDSGKVTIECTKRAAIYGLWGVWSLFGKQLFADLIDQTFAMTRHLYEQLSNADDFAPMHEPQCNIQVFRYLPDQKYQLSQQQVGELNLKIRRRLIESGQFYLVQTSLDGVGALRTCLMNPLTETSDLDQLLDAIRATATDILENT